MEDIKNKLNDSQFEAVVYNDGASVIVAGAGSGKTRVLTYKIAYLIGNGIASGRILALTFTNKAAKEMKERIISIVGNKLASYLWAGTFHSQFLKILQKEIDAIGFLPNFTIYDTQDSKSLVKSIIKELNLDEKTYPPNSIYSRISKMKNGLITPQIYLKDSELVNKDFHFNRPLFKNIYSAYCQRCKESNAMDFDDILIHTYFLFKNNPEILEHYQNRFDYILVDEYQDTNIAQHHIINMLANKHQRIAVVGDDAQSIYSFRGANIDNILFFQKSFDSCKIFKLEENYRSTKTIVEAANSLIEKNRHQIPKKVYSNLEQGEKIQVISCFSDREEAQKIAAQIEQTQTRGVAWSEIAILYRTNAQSRALEDALRNSLIPHRIYGGISFYSRKEVKDVLAYMRITVNHLDEESLKRIINYPTRGIGTSTQQKLFAYAHKEHKNSLDVIFNIDSEPIDLKQPVKNRLKNFASLIGLFSEYYNSLDAYQTAEKIIYESGIMGDLKSNDDVENLSRRENIQELLSAIHEYCQQKREDGVENPSLANFLTEISLLTDQDTDSEDNINKVTLMTIHAAKGLEFRYVFVAGMEEELFPSNMCETEKEIEEERRLFYVAITRTKERCFLSYSKTRFRYGNVIYTSPSRFLEDISREFLEMPTAFVQSGYEATTKRQSPSVFPSMNTNRFNSKKHVVTTTIEQRLKPIPKTTVWDSGDTLYQKGDLIRHSIFGKGEIKLVTDRGQKAIIEFDNVGEKTLLLKYAKLELINHSA